MGLGRKLAFAGKLRPGRDVAVEPCGDRRRIDGKHEPRRTALAEIGGRGQLEAEIDRLILPIELARAGERIGDGRQA